MNIAINEIKISNRIRHDLGNLDMLAQSIKKMGLIHPIILSEDYELLSGHRRLEACKALGRETIEVKIVAIGEDKLTKIDWEYHENIGRKDLEADETEGYLARREEIMTPNYKSLWTKLLAFFKRIIFFWRKKG
jgi:ParB family transcriptional regulator, chromosome partitioning protein